MLSEKDDIPEIFRLIQKEATRERSSEEEEAARRFVLGYGTLKDYVEARHKVR